MKIKDLFNLILKIFGLILLKDVLLALISVLSMLAAVLMSSQTNTFDVSFFEFFNSFLYVLICSFFAYVFIFRTGWIIQKLKLNNDFSDKDISLNLSSTCILTIAIIIIGGWLIVNEVPNFCSQLYYILLGIKQKNIPIQNTAIIIPAVKIIIGLLLVGEQKRIVAFLDKRKIK
ncbi:MAG TPA: hypothetical protein VFQ86_13370 [Arachidicoccus soli]|uniref:Uncharacterized protein n=1 Tax=Arachidicoccus soli TaxID=2341117 RepID=A0A386HNB3_9BACT|nr:hypothetical protein [Arachidicoccus soli]AYD47000.1 hypothetical protein D6B99_04855 [Arachidicoccus soli]HEU0228723.1 hypothetical protein [Arachidicoccus soli]